MSEGGDGSTHRLDDAEIAGFATLLAAAGSETVTKLVGNGVVLFARHPDEWRKLLDDPDKARRRSRGGAPLLGAVAVPGPLHAPPLRSSTASRSPRECRCSSSRARRTATSASTTTPTASTSIATRGSRVGLGHGIHSCLGAALARLESRVAFDELRTRWPSYEVDDDGLRRVQMSNVAGFSNVPVHRAA